jgi:hypothetical protein
MSVGTGVNPPTQSCRFPLEIECEQTPENLLVGELVGRLRPPVAFEYGSVESRVRVYEPGGSQVVKIR